MEYNLQVTDEAVNDMGDAAIYIRSELCNPAAADRLLKELQHELMKIGRFPKQGTDSGIRYRNYTIHKKVYQSYLFFYVFDERSNTITILRVLKNIMNWPGILRETKIYHFSNYKNK